MVVLGISTFVPSICTLQSKLFLGSLICILSLPACLFLVALPGFSLDGSGEKKVPLGHWSGGCCGFSEGGSDFGWWERVV